MTTRRQFLAGAVGLGVVAVAGAAVVREQAPFLRRVDGFARYDGAVYGESTTVGWYEYPNGAWVPVSAFDAYPMPSEFGSNSTFAFVADDSAPRLDLTHVTNRPSRVRYRDTSRPAWTALSRDRWAR